jgi:hypothetical protein
VARVPRTDRAMRMWFKICLRVMALANLVFALLGGYDIRVAITAFPSLRHAAAHQSLLSDFPYGTQVFWIMTTVSALFLVALLVCGYCIWRLRPIGLVIGNMVYGSELAYWLFSMYAVRFALSEFRGAQSILGSIAIVGPLANSGLFGQFRIWYPLMAIVLLNVSYLRIRALPTRIAE